MKLAPVRMQGAVTNVLVAAAMFGALGGLGAVSTMSPYATTPLGWGEVPAPHTVPLVAGGTSLRLAMVHDVLHQRYLAHSPAWAAAVESRARTTIAAAQGPPTDALLSAMDDLGVALDRQRRSDEAVAVLREKLALVEAVHGPPPAPPATPPSEPASGSHWEAADPVRDARFRRIAGRDPTPAELAWYRTWANLGTFLVHASFPRARAGDAAGRAGLLEGEALVLRSLEVNPGAHFGRETWQAVAIAALRRAIDRPDELGRITLMGDLLEQPVGADDRAGEGDLRGPLRRVHRTPLHRFPDLLRRSGERWIAVGLDPAARLAAADDALWIREAYITRTGDGLPGLTTLVTTPVPFDEPTLGVLGMWTLGGGPNPHFALALGELMLRVGQGPLAWSAFQRARGLAPAFWPDPAVQARLVAHLDARQRQLEGELGQTRDELKSVFDRELALGTALQAAQAEFEARVIAAGADPADPHLLDDFVRGWEAEHGPIASPVGDADLVAVRRTRPLDVLWATLFMAGVGAVLGLFVRSSRKCSS